MLTTERRANAARPRWDVRTEACTAALTTAGRTVTAGTAEILETADELCCIAAPTPGETVALIEFLLAVCYASGCCPETEDEWEDWVIDRQPLASAAEWLRAQPTHEWDLFDPVAPFGQNALLAPFLEEHGAGPAQLVIEHVGDYNQFFDHHHLEHPTPLSAAAAFRALLAQHAYGPSGRARISGKETLGPAITNLAVTRLGSRIRVIAQGDTLGDTLRLNLAPYPQGAGTFNRTWTQKERRGFRSKPTGRPVDGPADLHTVLGRSVLMRPAIGPDGGVTVDRVLIGAGELLVPLAAPYMQDAIYATTTAGATKPLWPSASRALWREAHALYAAVADRSKGTDLYGRIAALPSGWSVTLWAVGLVAKQTTAIAWVSDVFPFVPGREAALRQAAETGSRIAEHVATCLNKAAYTAWSVAYPNPKPADKKAQIARFDARGEHWAATAQPFHVLLEEAAGGSPVTDALRTYAATLHATARRLLEHRLASLPPNSRGFRARAEATERLSIELGKNNPAPAKEATPA
ncbi:type I-E CRISPR-associated protein Cse1/CasA [Streptomyces sp. NPDC059866]|uniref:type I-E CRISPR-associated protein Cse1/CasA n=1 Tax=Streptomyces sp. NPDC059866 TaxID=3346978 RepID=UPI00365CE18D